MSMIWALWISNVNDHVIYMFHGKYFRFIL